MEINYRRERNHNYLVAGPKDGNTGYVARMLAGNDIRGLLRMHIKFIDGSPFYYYDITSRQPLSRILETRNITRDEICQVLIQLQAALEGMDEYMLGDQGLLLDPEYIYVDPEMFQPRFCLLPEQNGSFSQTLNRLLQYILKCVNHKDRDCVVLAYGLYQESLKDNYGMEDLLRFLTPSSQEQAERPKEEHRRDRDTEPAMHYEPEDKSILKTMPEPELSVDESPQERNMLPLILRQIFLWLSITVLAPGLFWLFKGRENVLQLRYIFVTVDLVILLGVVIGDIILYIFNNSYRRNSHPQNDEKTEKENGKENVWKILYEDDEEEALLDTVPHNVSTKRERPKAVQPQPEPEEPFQTTLLSENGYNGDLRRLTSVCAEYEDIVIPYYPYVIGKHKSLADYVLTRDTVSRFHLRIEEREGQYMVTDLNSTNGTKVKGCLIDANETVNIEPGDEVCIADLVYIFN